MKSTNWLQKVLLDTEKVLWDVQQNGQYVKNITSLILLNDLP